jgi:NMD protein affecting ribosome stability and mRNA decay
MSTYRIVTAFSRNSGSEVKKCIPSKVLSPHRKGEGMYRMSETIRIVPARDGQIVLDISRGQVLYLNVTAALIVDQLQRGKSESEISEVIGNQFHVSREAAKGDIEEFLRSLADRGLLLNDSTKPTQGERTLACDTLSGEF